MQQPVGYEVPGKWFVKSLYGWAQAVFKVSFQDFILSFGLQQSTADPCVFTQAEAESRMTIVAVYVDDLIVMSTAIEKLNAVKKALSGRFKMKDLGPLHYFLTLNSYCFDNETLTLYKLAIRYTRMCSRVEAYKSTPKAPLSSKGLTTVDNSRRSLVNKCV